MPPRSRIKSMPLFSCSCGIASLAISTTAVLAVSWPEVLNGKYFVAPGAFFDGIPKVVPVHVWCAAPNFDVRRTDSLDASEQFVGRAKPLAPQMRGCKLLVKLALFAMPRSPQNSKYNQQLWIAALQTLKPNLYVLCPANFYGSAASSLHKIHASLCNRGSFIDVDVVIDGRRCSKPVRPRPLQELALTSVVQQQPCLVKNLPDGLPAICTNGYCAGRFHTLIQQPNHMYPPLAAL